MGHRNPFRFEVDSETGWIYQGEVGPDAGSASATRGPVAHDELNQIRGPGNYGWPYCVGPDLAYIDYDFATGASGSAFDCDAPTNTAPRNTGLEQLPDAEEPLLWYPPGTSSQFPELGSGGRTAMGGPVYHYDPSNPSPIKFPAYYDDTAFFYEWTRNYVKELKLDEDGELLQINPFLPGGDYRRPMDMEFGPDGALYVLEYGTGGYFAASEDAGLFRIEYTGGDRTPVAEISASPTSGQAPLAVSFSSDGSSDPDGGSLSYAWDFTNDGSTDSTAANPSHTYTSNGTYTAKLTVTASDGDSGTATVVVTVGNTAPTVAFSSPPSGGFFAFGEDIPYAVAVTDAEDGSDVDCAQVEVSFILGHDAHGHPLSSATGCSGSLPSLQADGHGDEADIFGVLVATYTDAGGLDGEAELVLQPKDLQAEHYDSQSGTQIASEGNAPEGGERVGYTNAGDWIAFDPVNLSGIDSVTLRTSGTSTSGVEFRIDSPTGQLIGSASVPSTGAWDAYTEVGPVTLDDPGGTHALYVVFTAGGMDLDRLTFNGAGVDVAACPGDDQFDGTALESCRWTRSVRVDDANRSVSGGSLTIATTPTDMYGGTTDGENLTLQDAPDGAWTATTKLTMDATDAYQQAGLMLHGSDDDFVKAAFIATPGGRQFEFIAQQGGAADDQGGADRTAYVAAGFPDTVWLRMTSDGAEVSASWSSDGTTFTPYGRSHPLAGMSNPAIGVYALHALHDASSTTASFDWFDIEPGT